MSEQAEEYERERADGVNDDELAALEDAIAKASEERDELRARVERATTELDKARDRQQRERDDDVRYANEKIANEIIPVLDNMERALAADPQSIVKGVYDELLETLARHGVAQFSTMGQGFDPHKAEAVSMREVEGTEPGLVIGELRKGYALNDRLLRPALVVVSG